MGWLRRGRKGASDEPLGKNDFLVYVRRYANEAASLEQFAEFKTWLVEYAGIDDWVFCGVAVAEDENGIFWYIAVVDATPDARTLNEFMWTGEPQEIDRTGSWTSSVGRRARLSSPGSSGLSQSLRSSVLTGRGSFRVPRDSDGCGGRNLRVAHLGRGSSSPPSSFLTELLGPIQPP